MSSKYAMFSAAVKCVSSRIPRQAFVPFILCLLLGSAPRVLAAPVHVVKLLNSRSTNGHGVNGFLSFAWLRRCCKRVTCRTALWNFRFFRNTTLNIKI